MAISPTAATAAIVGSIGGLTNSSCSAGSSAPPHGNGGGGAFFGAFPANPGCCEASRSRFRGRPRAMVLTLAGNEPPAKMRPRTFSEGTCSRANAYPSFASRTVSGGSRAASPGSIIACYAKGQDRALRGQRDPRREEPDVA